MKNTLVLAGLIMGALLLGIASYIVYEQNPKGVSEEDEVSKMVEELGEPTITIVRTDAGYEPSEVTIKKGDIVLWTNESNEFHWPASDLHPTHSIYSEFDPLKPIAPGDAWKFKFEEVGVWKFHDHIRANKVGTVTVVE